MISLEKISSHNHADWNDVTNQTLFCWVPNALTGSRLVLGLLLPFAPDQWQFSILVFAGFTDLIDGWIARQLRLTPRYGQLADPIADKILVLGAVYAVMRGGWITWPELLALISRDIAAVILSAIALIYGQENWKKLKPTISGKLATAAQIAVLAALFWQRSPLTGAVCVAAAFSVVAACDYSWRAMRTSRLP